MHTRRTIAVIIAAVVLLLLGATLASTQDVDQQRPAGADAALGTAFTYQGRLQDASGDPVSDTCDFRFDLYDVAADGTPLATTTENVTVTDGLFTAALDFGDVAFNGEARWLEIAVQCGGDSDFTSIGRQPLTPAPYALALPGLSTEQTAASPNLIGGYHGNSAADGVVGATIGGGGANLSANSVGDDYGTVAGGSDNTAGGLGVGATVGGGQSNAAPNTYSTVAGGYLNSAGGNRATIGGGESNLSQGFRAFIGGGYNNNIGSGAQHATIGGGQSNQISNDGDDGSIVGGSSNSVVAVFGSVGGGEGNTAGGDWSTVGGGSGNEATSNYATVGGGISNQATSQGATVPGGHNNVAAGSFSFAAGRRAKANHSGAFVWADATDADFTSTGGDQFLIRATGGVGVGTNAPGDAQLYVQDANCCTDVVEDNHIAVVENTSTNSAADVLALKANRSTPNTGVNFITFFDATTIVGEIEGDGAGGIVLDSASSDFAERLPKKHPAEPLVPGDIVGVDNGQISRQTAGADRAMAVSTAPIVVGNRPADSEADAYEAVAFVGQTPVKVRGRVNAGDYIVPSGHNDGVGVAVSLEAITADRAPLVVGRALEAADGPDVTQVNTLVGLPQGQIWQTVLARRNDRIAQLESQVQRLSEENAALAARMGALEEKVNAQDGTAGVSLPNLLLGGLLLVGAVAWQRSRDEEILS